MPTVVGEMMPFRFGYAESRPCRTVRDVAGSSLPYTVATRCMFGYLAASCVFIAAIQAFWLVALAAADRMAMSPVLLICFASRSTSEVPICWVSAWLMNRWFGQVMSESNETTLIPADCAW